jgi:hypothetical protein
MSTQDSASLELEAHRLVKLNQSEIRTITASYFFPDPEFKVIRLVHVDSTMFPEDAVMPIAFSRDPGSGLSHPSLIAITDPGGPTRLHPPDGWGDWSDAHLIERPRRQRAI